MSQSVPPSNKALTERLSGELHLGGLFNLVLLGAFCHFAGLKPDQGLLGAPSLDLIWGSLICLIGVKHGRSFFETALWMVLTRQISLNALETLQAFPQLVSLFWFGWSLFLGWGPRSRDDLLIGAWLGLTFDPAITTSLGMGMSVGWNALPLNLLILSALARPDGWPCLLQQLPRVPSVLLLAGSCWLLLNHGQGPASFLTGSILTTVTLVFVLVTRILATPGGKSAFFLTITIASLPILLSALGMTLFQEGIGLIALQKRLFAGGLHPNLFAAFSLAILLFLVTEKDWGFFPNEARRLCRIGLIGLVGVILLASGGRISLAIFLLLLPLSWRMSRTLLTPRNIALILALIGLIGMRFWWGTQGNEWALNERFFIWKSALDAISQHPWQGNGLLAYFHLPQRIDPLAGILVFDWNYPHTHSLYLEMTLAGGFPLLLMGLTYAGWGLLRIGTGSVFLPVCLGILAQGVFDFVWFSPCMIALSLAAFLPESERRVDDPPQAGDAPLQPVAPACSPESGEMKPSITPQIIAIVLLPLIGFPLFLLGSGDLQFREGLDRLRSRDPLFLHSLDRAVLSQPNHLQMRLQRLFIRWSTGIPPETDADELAALSKTWPDYYLIPYLRGRLETLRGNDLDACRFFHQSLDGDPHDTFGIRWAHLAMAQARSGADCSQAAWFAVCRRTWGAALLLDHPTDALHFWTKAVSHALASPTFTPEEKVGFLQAFDSALSRRFGFGEFKRLRDGPRFVPCPAYVLDHFESLKLESQREGASDQEIIQRASTEKQSFGLSRSIWMSRAAARLGSRELLAESLEALRRRWVYRNKNSEFLLADYLLLRQPGLVPASQSESLAIALREKDPGNPWIWELLGDIQEQTGSSEQAILSWQQARALIPQARLEPMFSQGPREWVPGPTGDEWTLAFEKLLRSRDPLAGAYHAQAWKEFSDRLEAKLRKTPLGR